MSPERTLRFPVSPRAGPVSAVLRRPRDAHALLVLAHGAGAGMHHPFLASLAAILAECGIATLRYQFPYAEAGRRRPDPRGVLLATVRAAVGEAAARSDGLPLVAGGKSMGGRMTSLAASEEALPGVRGIVFFGFPLHPAGRPGSERGEHLRAVPLPLLFLQGERDRLAELRLLRPLCAQLGERAELLVVPQGDHSFRVPRRTGRSADDVLHELALRVREWSAALP